MVMIQVNVIVQDLQCYNADTAQHVAAHAWLVAKWLERAEK